MSWAIERDEHGQPVRMVWMGRDRREPKKPRKLLAGCPGCGFHFGWHAKGCTRRAVQPSGRT